jgi:proton-translocating NADH-quinone oxidoreductase chain N
MSDITTIFLPFLILIGTLLICLLIEAYNIGKRFIAPITILGSLLTLYTLIVNINHNIIHVFWNPEDLFSIGTGNVQGLFVIDNFYRFFSLIFLIVLIFVVTSSIDYISSESNIGVYYALLIFSTIGMMLIAASNDLLALFVAWELGSLPAYSLAAFQKSRTETSESALKFFLIGAMSSAFILFGISLIYGITSEMITTLELPATTSPTNLKTVVQAFSDVSSYSPLHLLALVFLFVGFGYKMAAVPFHAWAVDVYQGTPTTITTFLAAGSKAMGFAAVFRLIVTGLTNIDMIWGTVFAILAVFTMTLGNVVALVQENIKRMLAYSSIAHAGYILIALAAIASEPNSSLNSGINFSIGEFSVAAAELHILTHALMKIVAFTVVIVVSFSLQSENISDYAGLRKKHPWLAFGMSISLLSLMGVPPLAGFMSKLLLFFAAIYADLIWLAVIGIINSAISIFYYIRVIKLMLIDKPLEEEEDTITVLVDRIAPYSIPISYKVTIATSVLLILVIGVFPAPFIEFALSAAKDLLPIIFI